MIEDRLVNEAKSYCYAYYGITPENTNHIEIANIPQIQTAQILSRYGYASNLIQCIALLSGLNNDPKIITGKIKKTFGYEISNGIYLLSPKTLSEKNFEHAFITIPMSHLIEEEDIYRFRLSIARKSVKKVKLAQIIQELENEDEKTVKKLSKKTKYLYIAKHFYLPMAKLFAEEMVEDLNKAIKKHNNNNSKFVLEETLVFNDYD